MTMEPGDFVMVKTLPDQSLDHAGEVGVILKTAPWGGKSTNNYKIVWFGSVNQDWQYARGYYTEWLVELPGAGWLR